MDISDRRALLLEALDSALKGLSTIPQDATVVQLIVDAQHLREEVAAWATKPPTDERVAAAEKHALGLHVAVGEVRR